MNAVDVLPHWMNKAFFPMNVQIENKGQGIGVPFCAWLKGSSVHQVLEFRVDERKHDCAGAV